MDKRGNILLIILVVVGLLAASVGGYFWWNSKKQSPEIKIVETKPVDETTNWKTYENRDYGYSIRYPQESTFLEPQLIPSESLAGPIYSLLIVLPKLSVPIGAATNVPAEFRMTYLPKGAQKKIDKSINTKTVVSQLKAECPNGEVLGPINVLISGKPTVKIIQNKCYEERHNLTYEIASTGGFFVSIQYIDTSAKEKYEPVFDQILSTFKFLDKDSEREAINFLASLPEIQTIEKSVLKAGRKPFFTPEGEKDKVVTVSLRESFPNDPHTSRIDTFNIDMSTKKITIYDVVTNKDVSYDDWRKTIGERFP